MRSTNPIRWLILASATMFLGILGCSLLSPERSRAQGAPPVNATAFHYNSQRTGWNPNETQLSPANVGSSQFGPLWSSPPLDSVTLGSTTYPPHLYATPLYVDNVQITSGTYAGQQFSVVFAATTNNYVYAINAFDVAGPPAVPAGTILWRKSLGTPTNFGLDGGVAVGILGTPVIDLNATPPRLYVAADAITDTPRSWKAFALDLGSGNILQGWPLAINNTTLASINLNGPATFQPTSAMSERGALNLSSDGSLLYVPFGAYGDGGAGWMVSVDTQTPQLASAFSGAPSSVAFANGGMWGSGGPAVDAAGNVYDTTGNSPSGSQNSPGVWGESLLVWPFDTPLQLAGTYTPWNYCQMDTADTDLGGSTPMVVPDLDPSTTSTPHLVAFGSKQGNAYLVNRDNLPGRLDQRPACSTDSTSDTSLLAPDPRPYYGGQIGPLNVFGPYTESCTQGDNARMRTTPAYFQGADGTNYIFVSGAQKQSACDRTPTPPGLARLRIVTSPGQPAYLAVDATDSALSLFSPGPPVVTSNGSSNAIAWVMDANVYRSASLVGSGVPHPVLYAVDANTMQVLWSSTSNQLNVGGKYNHATIARGVVFVGTDRIQAFGLNASQGGGAVEINSGGPGAGQFMADTDFAGGHADTFTNLVDLSGVTNPAPEQIYQSKRTDSVGFTYTIPGLSAGQNYLVRLHFCESTWNAPGQRVFNVSINGAPVLTNFDIFQTAGGMFKALVEEFTAMSNFSNQIVIAYTAGSAGNALSSGIEVIPQATPAGVAINAGGGDAPQFVSDRYFTGGHADTFANAIDVSGVSNPAPQAVYQSKRTDSVGFTYMIPNLVAGHSYTLRLHFTESAHNGPGQRLFSVAINGAPVLNNFDIFQASGAEFRATIQQFSATPDSSGQIVIQYTASSVGNALASGIEILP